MVWISSLENNFFSLSYSAVYLSFQEREGKRFRPEILRRLAQNEMFWRGFEALNSSASTYIIPVLTKLFIGEQHGLDFFLLYVRNNFFPLSYSAVYLSFQEGEGERYRPEISRRLSQ